MKIVKNCWKSIGAFDCQYGAHLFEGSTLKIYVNHWLAVGLDLMPFFHRRNEDGFVGHCLLVFHGVKKYNFSVRTYTKEDGVVNWNEPVIFGYSGSIREDITAYSLEGSLHGFPSSVSISIEAQEFELHILENDEPAKSA